MNTALKSIWDSYMSPMLRRPKRLQVAALCHRGAGDDKEYLLVTSRDTGRWIIPKGWPIRGLKSNEAALQEAWEEAGVRNSKATRDPIGSYNYNKRQKTGWLMPVTALVYSVCVEELCDEFPEVKQRTRKWVKATDAAEMVNEAQLKSIFLAQ